MTQNTETRRKLIEIALPVCAGAGYELVDIQYVREQAGWVVRVFIDWPQASPDEKLGPGLGIDLADCEQMSRQLSAVLDVEDPVPQAYNLEVSSPGVDRPLRTPAHFRRFLGCEARVQMREPKGGRRRYKGALVAADDATFTIEVDGTRFTLPVDDVQSARLVPDWDALMRKQG